MLDAISSKAPKLSALLSLTPTAKLLVAGEDWDAWDDELRAHFGCVTNVRTAQEMNRALSDGEAYDLVLLAPSRRCWGKSLLNGETVVRVRKSLSPRGSVLLLARNGLSLTGMLRPFDALSSASTVAGAWRTRMHRAGLYRVEEFLPLPSIRSPEEFVSSRHGKIILSRRASLLDRAASRLGALPLFHEGWLYFASRPEAGTHPLLRGVAHGLRARNSECGELRVDRFDLRERGALVLLLSQSSGGSRPGSIGIRPRIGAHESTPPLADTARVVCRVTADARTNRGVRQNAAWVSRLHQSSRLPLDAKSLVPRSLGDFDLPSGHAYAESLIEGAIGWKLVGTPRVEARLFDTLYAFVRTLGRSTARLTHVDTPLFAALARPAYQLCIDEETSDLLTVLVERLRTRLVDTSRTLVWAHGDFGYGNAIAESRSGTLRGVIDWEQAREDLAGTDLLNFLVQRQGMLQKCDPLSLFSSLARRFVVKGFRGLDARLDYEELFPSTQASRKDIAGFAALRFAQRIAMYPAVFVRSRLITHELLRRTCALMQE